MFKGETEGWDGIFSKEKSRKKPLSKINLSTTLI